ncbi:hypothetical protein [Pedobacter heparinus]|uniref:hypothetical protein n=1 Tax=Pedobacter heparinus TaxID=984 RepID=UPI00292ECB52|nr:hypothetical protein [Pedobacter heparinus]
MKKFFLGIVSILFINESNAQNLINLEGWTPGQASINHFTTNGQLTENIREWGDGPHGKRVIVWKAQPDGNVNDDGGWNSYPFDIDHTKMYRFSVWIKKTNSHNGTSYFGCENVTDLDGTAHPNAYFWYGDLPELNKWYLLVGYIHGSGDASQTSLGGIYDGTTGAKVLDCTDFKFFTTTVNTYHRSYLYYDNEVSDRQYFYAPRVDLVNGDEPSIQSLLGTQSALSEQTYFSGNVGIGTTDSRGYKLAVNGKIRAQEIKVEAFPWPDYVFTKDYQLPTLQQTEQHIKEKGHLPGIPSAVEVKTNGIDLGEMNAKLLQKIEELTLYLLKQDKRINSQQEILARQQIEIQALKK